ncbi:hypothetical protein [Microbacterium sp. G2-8]|uniref:hypothetical protein n=1 Tax=Microbacterium sp. G2-8 TaxID=2842454 RepID=UPI0021AA7D51|nr:hypothetical protein [Microbacterium sp. G2-8]
MVRTKGRGVGFIQGYDPETLQEIVDREGVYERLVEVRRQRSFPAQLEQVWLLKVLGEIDEALQIAEHAVRLARMSGTRKDLLHARILHATVNQRRGSFSRAEAELTTCIEEAEGQSWPRISALAHSHRGKTRYDAGDYAGARSDFKRELFLRQELGADDEQLEVTMNFIDAAERKRSTDRGIFAS